MVGLKFIVRPYVETYGAGWGLAFIAAMIGLAFVFDRRPMHIEDKIDFGMSILVLVCLFGGLLFLPRSWIWYWSVPLVIFWVRWNVVMLRREQARAQPETDLPPAEHREPPPRQVPRRHS